MALNVGGFYEAWQGNQLRDAQIKQNQQIQQQNALKLLDMQNQQDSQSSANKHDLWSLLGGQQQQAPAPQLPPVELYAPTKLPQQPANNGPMQGGFQPSSQR